MLECRDLTVRFGAISALDEASLAVASGEVVSVVGPSGSGKSTLLRVVAGLQRPDHGDVAWDGETITDVPAYRRGFGLMFQDYALFPHRDVAGNVAFGLEMRGWGREAIDARVAELLDLVGLSEYGPRRVTELSGGEQQRVALARTLAPSPRLVMLDEPLGALDRALREELLVEMVEIFEELDAAVLYVTHDQEEAFGVADRVAVMNEGRIVAVDTPEALWNAPPSVFVAQFMGRRLVEGTVSDGVADIGFASVPWNGPDGRHLFVLRPGAVQVDPGGDIVGTVVASRYRAGAYEVTVRVGSGVEIAAVAEHKAAPGREVRLRLEDDALVRPAPGYSTSSEV